MGSLPRPTGWWSLLSVPTGAGPRDADATASRARPGRVWYLVAATVLVAGVATGLWMTTVRAPALVDGMSRLTVPGTTTVTFGDSGDHTLFHEYPTGSSPTLPSLPRVGASDGDLHVEVVAVDGGPNARVRGLTGDVSYTLGGTHGVGVGRVTVPVPGTYELTAELPPGAAGGTLAIDADGVMGTGFFGAFAGGILLVMASGALGVVGIVGVLVARILTRRHRPGTGPPSTGGPPPPPPARPPTTPPGDTMPPPRGRPLPGP